MVRLGLDAELFLTQNGKAVAPHEVLPIKENVKWFTTSVGDCAWYRDGFLGELNFGRGLACRGHIGMGVKESLNRLRNNLPSRYGLSAEPFMEITFEKEVPAEVYDLGCLPSSNVYGEPFRLLEVDPQKTPFRTSGCHLHVSNDTPGFKANPERLVPLFDKYVGLPLTFFSTNPDLERGRRSLYGRAGEHRLTTYKDGSHGIEYRVPSGMLLMSPPLLSLALGVMRAIFEGAIYKSPVSKEESTEIRAMINEGCVNTLFPLDDWYTRDTLAAARGAIWKYAWPTVNAHDFGWDMFRSGIRA